MVAKINSSFAASKWLRWVLPVALATLGLWCFPLFHVVRLSTGTAAVIGAGDPAVVADTVWREQLPKARADDMAVLAAALKKNPKEAIARYGRQVGLGGTAYFFVHGEGRVIARDAGSVRLSLDEGENAPVIELQTGLIFGNGVRDGSGLLDVNRFPSLQEFKALSAELNKLVESRVLPHLRERAQVGTTVRFTGCAEAAEPGPGRPLLSIIPIQAELKP